MKKDFGCKKEKYLPTPTGSLRQGCEMFLLENLFSMRGMENYSLRLMTFKLYLPVGLTVTLPHVQPTLPAL